MKAFKPELAVPSGNQCLRRHAHASIMPESFEQVPYNLTFSMMNTNVQGGAFASMASMVQPSNPQEGQVGSSA